MEQLAGPRARHRRRWVVRAHRPTRSRWRFPLRPGARCLRSRAVRSRTMRCSSWSVWAWKTDHRWHTDGLRVKFNIWPSVPFPHYNRWHVYGLLRHLHRGNLQLLS